MRIKKAQEKADRIAAREQARSDQDKLRQEADLAAAQAKEREKALERQRQAAETRAEETAEAEHQAAIADLQARRESLNRARAQRKDAEAELADIENAHRARITRLENELKLAKGEEAVDRIREATARLAAIDDERDGRYIDLRKKVEELRAVEKSMEEGLAQLEANMLSTGFTRREIYPKPKRGEGIVIYDGPYPAEGPPAAVTARSADGPAGARYDIGLVQVTGDRAPVRQLENWEQYINDAMYSPMSEQDIEAFRQTVLKDLQDDATSSPPSPSTSRRSSSASSSCASTSVTPVTSPSAAPSTTPPRTC